MFFLCCTVYNVFGSTSILNLLNVNDLICIFKCLDCNDNKITTKFRSQDKLNWIDVTRKKNSRKRKRDIPTSCWVTREIQYYFPSSVKWLVKIQNWSGFTLLFCSFTQRKSCSFNIGNFQRTVNPLVPRAASMKLLWHTSVLNTVSHAGM